MPAARLDSGPAAARAPRPASPASALATASSGLFVVAAMVIIAAGLRAVSSIVAPSFLVLTLVITVQPLRSILVRRRVPSWAASVVVMLSVYGLLILVLGSAVWTLTVLVDTLPQYADEFTNLFNSALDQLSKYGVETTDLRRAIAGFNLSSFAGVASQVLSTITSGLSLLVLLLAMVVFITFDAAGIGERIDLLRRYRPNIANALIDFAHNVRKYWVVTTIFGLIVAVIDVVALLIIGVPLALTWGVLAFVTNYIPNIGFLLGLIPPTLIALLDGGWGAALAVVISYSAVNVVIQTLIQPRFTGDAVGITSTIAFLSLIIWALILGPLGALLAVPATLLVKSLLVDHADRGRWLGVLLNATPDQVDPEHPITDAPDVDKDTHGEPKPAVTQEAGRPEQRSGAPSGSG
jgi:predicted PurR-regulated permease PerM